MTGGVAVVLGTTGRNFAAGMSGGVAYVLDLDPNLVNREMVELSGLDDEAAAVVGALVKRHAEETESPVASGLVTDWPTAAARFTQVLPTDYKRVLEARKAAETAGDDPMQAIMEAAHG
jgi:glutamate synthase (NADPH/NADH) large chain